MCAVIQAAGEPAQVWLCGHWYSWGGSWAWYTPETAVTPSHCSLDLPWRSTSALSAHLIKQLCSTIVVEIEKITLSARFPSQGVQVVNTCINLLGRVLSSIHHETSIQSHLRLRNLSSARKLQYFHSFFVLLKMQGEEKRFQISKVVGRLGKLWAWAAGAAQRWCSSKG